MKAKLTSRSILFEDVVSVPYLDLVAVPGVVHVCSGADMSEEDLEFLD